MENEQLKLEINELKEKLKEKMEVDEFEALEKQTQKDHEVRCIDINTRDKNSLCLFSIVYSLCVSLDADSQTDGVKAPFSNRTNDPRI